MKLKNKGILITILISASLVGTILLSHRPNIPIPKTENSIVPQTSFSTPVDNANLIATPDKHMIKNIMHVYQTFNNCGPAGLSMLLNYYGVNDSQDSIAAQIRPYQHPKGDNDDKSVNFDEFADYIKKYNLSSINRPNGDIELLKHFTANDIPVLVRSWLNPNDDIGHFRLVRGYDQSERTVIQDDSYHGSKLRISYVDFLSMWEPFGYEYFVIFQEKDRELINKIIGEDINEETAWKNFVERSQTAVENSRNNPYPNFNLSAAYYHLGEYEKSVEAFEKVENQLPKRMLWYQIEPILSYQKLKKFDKVFEMTENILSNGNRAFSELYMIRGEIYMEQDRLNEAKSEFEKALQFNKYFKPAENAIQNIHI